MLSDEQEVLALYHLNAIIEALEPFAKLGYAILSSRSYPDVFDVHLCTQEGQKRFYPTDLTSEDLLNAAQVYQQAERFFK